VRIWAEPEVVDAAAFDFSETEEFLQAAEALTCPYAWTRYDVLCMPPSFPYGGMENPCLTFVTPTLLTGDKSLADVIAHEVNTVRLLPSQIVRMHCSICSLLFPSRYHVRSHTVGLATL
jgi:hypothetical protein